MRVLFKAVVSGLCSALIAGAALAQSFPNKTVTLVVPYPAGGAFGLLRAQSAA